MGLGPLEQYSMILDHWHLVHEVVRKWTGTASQIPITLVRQRVRLPSERLKISYHIGIHNLTFSTYTSFEESHQYTECTHQTASSKVCEDVEREIRSTACPCE